MLLLSASPDTRPFGLGAVGVALAPVIQARVAGFGPGAGCYLLGEYSNSV